MRAARNTLLAAGVWNATAVDARQRRAAALAVHARAVRRAGLSSRAISQRRAARLSATKYVTWQFMHMPLTHACAVAVFVQHVPGTFCRLDADVSNTSAAARARAATVRGARTWPCGVREPGVQGPGAGPTPGMQMLFTLHV